MWGEIWNIFHVVVFQLSGVPYVKWIAGKMSNDNVRLRWMKYSKTSKFLYHVLFSWKIVLARWKCGEFNVKELKFPFIAGMYIVGLENGSCASPELKMRKISLKTRQKYRSHPFELDMYGIHTDYSHSMLFIHSTNR